MAIGASPFGLLAGHLRMWIWWTITDVAATDSAQIRPNGVIGMSMKSPVHPGSLVREDCLVALELSVTAAAAQLGVTRQTLSNLTNEKTALTPEMSIRLEKLGWGKADAWVRMQAAYDLAQVRLVQD